MIFTVTLNPALDKTVVIPSFEAGAVNRVTSMRLDAGGKGINVSKVIQSLGGKSKAIGLLAGRTGDFVKGYLDELGIESSFCFVDGETRTNLKIIDSVKKTNTDINEPGPSICLEDLIKIEEILRDEVKAGDVVVFSGSIPPKGDVCIYQRLIEACRIMGAQTILDADGELLKNGIKASPHLIKPNIHELERLFGRTIDSMEEALFLGRTLVRDFSIGQVVVSFGDKGALYIEKHQAFLAKGILVEAKSTVGAGDAMVAALALCLERGYDRDKTIRLSMASGVANVLTTGTQAAPLEKIMELEEHVHYVSL